MLIVMVMAVAAAPLWGVDSRDGRDWQARGEWQVREEMGHARARTAMP